MKGKRWTKEEVEILKANYLTLGPKKIQPLLPDRNYRSIIEKVRARGLDLISRNEDGAIFITRCRADLDHTFFNIPDINNCYWAGFIAADGSISDKNHSLSIELGELDHEHLVEFKNQIKFNGNLYHRKFRKNKICNIINDKIYYRNNKTSYSIKIYSYKVIDKLKEHWNITPRKTLTLMPPNIYDKNLCFSYIIGLIDGDGCIGIYDRIKNKDTKYLRISIVGTKNLLEWVKDTLENFLDFKGPNVLKKKNQKIFSLSWTGNNAKLILNELKKIPINYKLNRKWCKILPMV